MFKLQVALFGLTIAAGNTDELLQRKPGAGQPTVQRVVPKQSTPLVATTTSIKSPPRLTGSERLPPTAANIKKPPVPVKTNPKSLPSIPSFQNDKKQASNLKDDSQKVDTIQKPAAPSPDVDTSKLASIQAIAKAMVEQLMAYYNCQNCQNGLGGIISGSGNNAKSFQWYEGGLLWSIMGEYMKTSQDFTHKSEFGQALTLASYREVGNFLGNLAGRGGSVLAGKYNDDVLWWSFGSMCGAEIFGAEAQMPGGIKYSQVTKQTFDDAVAVSDDQCLGGIWWKQDKSDSENSKTTITNVQAMQVAARLAIVLKNDTYNQQAASLYKWLKAVDILSKNYTVFDGVKVLDPSTGKCAKDIREYSYNSGMLIGTLAWMTRATKDPSYVADAEKIFQQYSLKKFAPDGIITDECEFNSSCNEAQATPKGTLARGWGHLHEATTNSQVKQQLKAVLKSSVDAMLKTCDMSYNCGNVWYQKKQTAYNVHYQMNAVELITAYLKTFYDGPVGKDANLALAPTDAPPEEEKQSFSISARPALILITLLFL